MKVFSLFFIGLFLLATDHPILVSTTNDKIETNYKLDAAFPALTFDMPVELVSPTNDTERVSLIEQKGRIMVFQNKPDVKNASVFLDIVKRVDSGGEKGLLGLAFHPEYKTSGYFYVNYTRSSPLETVISRFQVASNGQVADLDSEQILLRFA